jgi:hypothetical protein
MSVMHVNHSCTRGTSLVLGHSNSNNALISMLLVFFGTPCILTIPFEIKPLLGFECYICAEPMHGCMLSQNRSDMIN